MSQIPGKPKFEHDIFEEATVADEFVTNFSILVKEIKAKDTRNLKMLQNAENYN